MVIAQGAPDGPDRGSRGAPADPDARRAGGRPGLTQKGTLRSVERALRALELVAGSGDGITAKAVARRLGCTLSTSYNILNTLVASGYLVRLPEARGYGLGYQVIALSGVLWDELAINADVRNAVANLHVQAGAAAYLAVYRDADVVVGHVVDSPGAPRLEPFAVGHRDGMHAVAFGKVLLAAMPDGRRHARLDGPLTAYTARTVVEPSSLDAELAALRDAPVVVEVGEYRPDSASVAAPIRLDGAVVASLGVSVPAGRLDTDRDRLVEALPRHAARVAAAMTGRATWSRHTVRTV